MIEDFVSIDIEINAASNGDSMATCKIQVQKGFIHSDDVTKLKAVLSHFKDLFANGTVSINSSDHQKPMQPRTRPLLPPDSGMS